MILSQKKINFSEEGISSFWGIIIIASFSLGIIIIISFLSGVIRGEIGEMVDERKDRSFNVKEVIVERDYDFEQGKTYYIHRCREIIDSKEKATSCFNSFFSQKINELRSKNIEIGEDVIFLYGRVREIDVVERNDYYQIIRGDIEKSPYFIEEGIIFFRY